METSVNSFGQITTAQTTQIQDTNKEEVISLNQISEISKQIDDGVTHYEDEVPTNTELLQDVDSQLRLLISDDQIPASLKKKFWWIFNKDLVLTFLDEDRKIDKMINFDIIKIDFLHTLNYFDYTFDIELLFSILRNMFETKLDRAVGYSNRKRVNERIIEQTQFTESKNINEEVSNAIVKSGIFSRLFNKKR